MPISNPSRFPRSTASADENETALTDMLAEVDTPWTEFLAYQAEAEALWAADFAADYLDYQEDLGDLDIAYATAANDAYVDAVGTIADADLDLSTTLSQAAYDEEAGQAAADLAYTTAMAVPEESYAVQQATQAQTYAVNTATIEETAATDPEVDEEAEKQAEDEANLAAVGANAGAFGVSQADINLTLATAAATAQQGRAVTTANAHYANAAAVAGARVTYATAESNAWYTREAAAAGLAKNFATSQASSYATRMTALATNHPTPWSDKARDIAIAEAQRVLEEAAADETKRLAHAGAERAREIADAIAEGDLFTAEALAARDKAIALANADYDKTLAAANALVDLAATGWHRPAGSYPTGLSLAGITHPSASSDWWKFEQDAYYANLVDSMFGEPAVYNQWSIFMSWHLYKGDRDFDDVLQEEVNLEIHWPDSVIELSTSTNESGQTIQTANNHATGEFTLTIIPSVGGDDWTRWDMLWQKKFGQIFAELDGKYALKDIPFVRPQGTDFSTGLRGLDALQNYNDAEKARVHLRYNLHAYKQQLADRVFELLTRYPPKRLPGDTSPPLSYDDRLRLANKVANAYIQAVDDFLRDHPGARPELGQRQWLFDKLGLENEKNSPWCADWANGILSSKHFDDIFKNDPLARKALSINGGQWRDLERGLQHNWVVLAPYGWDPMASDNMAMLFLDPWFDITPRMYWPGENGHPPLTGLGIK